MDWPECGMEWNGECTHVQLVLSIKAELATMCLGLLSAGERVGALQNQCSSPLPQGWI